VDSKISYLQIIQGIINRLASNSFLLQGWSVTLVSAIVALGVKDAQKPFVLLAYFPAVMFWILDAYFLSEEKRFRALYDLVSNQDPGLIGFSLDVKHVANFSNSWPRSFFTGTLVFFHGFIVATILIVLAVT